jgi:UDP:flavonoid glycosyltransferase YjiC (YdhE family)
MRVIFVAWAWPSHLSAMVPLAWACRASGHEVLVASQPSLAAAAAGVGLPVITVGTDVDAVATFREIATAPPSQRTGGPRVLRLLTQLAETMTGDLARWAKAWRADLIVYEPTALAGPLAAQVAGIPAVRHLFGTDLLSRAHEFLATALAPLCGTLGLDSADPFGTATIDPCPDGLQGALGSRRIPVRYVPYSGLTVVPALDRPRSHRPLVCVTWGTTLSRLDPALFHAGDVARWINDLDVDVLVAVTSAQHGLLGTLPARTRVVTDTPLHLLLPGCAAVVAHGGAGTLLTSLDSGLPQLLVPRLPDHMQHASRLAEAGAAAVVPAAALDPAVIRDRLDALLAEPGYRECAERLQKLMRAQPPPAAVVADLERAASS